MGTQIFTGNVNGIELKIKDLATSVTAPFVFEELRANCYGLEDLTITPDDLVIDVGANVGIFSIYVRKKFGCRVISFEPVPLNFNHLKENISLNDLTLEGWELHNKAVTATEGGEIEIVTPAGNTGGSSAFLPGGVVSICKTERLGKYLGGPCKYLKIDTEGGEFEIIPDILGDLGRVDCLGIEYHKFNGAQNPEALHELIKQNFVGSIFFNAQSLF